MCTSKLASVSRLRALALFLFAASALSTAQAAPKMNVVLILADDLGWRDIGCYGSTFHQTPNIDRLFAEGMSFSNAYSASPLCSPTRSSIMTGFDPARIGITAPVCHLERVNLTKGLVGGNPGAKILVADSVTRLETRYYTLAEALRDAGYRTAHFGKWHLGPEPYSPLEHGFEVDLPHTPGPGPGGGNGYFAPWRFWPEAGKKGEHIDDRMAKEAVKFLREHRDEPFYMNFWPFEVHSPWMGKEKYIREAERRADPAAPQRNPVYASMVRSLDDAVGRVLDTLEELDLVDKTVVIFASDNGGWHNVADGTPSFNPKYNGIPVTSNAPLKSGKASLYEGGTRTPLIIRWPGRTKPGSTSDALFQSTDFYPTLVEGLGIDLAETPDWDGVSQFPTLSNPDAGQREAVYCHFPHSGRADIAGFVAGTSVRRGPWKLIRFFVNNEDGTDRHELFHVVDDPGENDNLASQRPDLVAELDALITAFLADTEAVVPTRNPSYRPPAEAVDGWASSRDAVLERSDSGYRLTATGKDPFISTAIEPAAKGGPFTVRITMQSTASGYAQVFWHPRRKSFRKEMSTQVNVIHQGPPTTWKAVLNTDSLTGLRIDPARHPGTVVMSRIDLINADGKTLLTWPTTN